MPDGSPWSLDNRLTVVLFAGLGGACDGLEAAGFPVHIAINHDPVAVAAHAARHPHTRHLRGDVWEVDPVEATGGRPVRILWASPDCFPAGTLVLTSGGHKPIEEVEVGDLVLTHKGRWRRVISSATRKAETVAVRGHGHYGLVTTPSHGFYSKRITRRYPSADPATGKRPGELRTLVENPYWPAATAMAGKLWATPRTFPAAAIPICKGVEFSTNFFYLMGRWIGDGSINKGDVEICCGSAELPSLRAIAKHAPLRSADGDPIPHRIVDHGSSALVVWGCQDLAVWLREEVGGYSESKRLPLWCLSMQRAWREALLAGYVDADGWAGARTETKTVSKDLAIGIRLLATTLGHAAALYRQDGRAGCIEGRTFMGRDTYTVAWRPEIKRQTVFQDGLHQYSPVREVVPAGEQIVISLQVEEDESFVADGIVVHNCRHFSRAKGRAPVSAKVRSLPWVVCRWAGRARPETIFLENVPEIATWGPLVARRCPVTGRVVKLDGTIATPGERVPVQQQQLTPDKARAGRLFKAWTQHLERLGYRLDFRELVAADVGIPTIRRRFFLVGHRDGSTAAWPERSHAPRSKAKAMKLKPWAPAASVIDWSLPCPSIFTRKKPLAEATLRRIARGVMRYVVEAAEPFIVPITHTQASAARGSSVGEPMRTITTARRGELALISPHVVSVSHGEASPSGTRRRGLGIQSLGDPMNTITKSRDHALVAGTLVQAGYGERPGQDPRALDVGQPFRTMVGANKHGVVAAFLAQHHTGVVGHPVTDPVSALSQSCSHQQPVAVHLTTLRGTSEAGRAIAEPAPAITAGGSHVGTVYAFLQHYYSQGGQDQAPTDPLGAVTTKARSGVVTVTVRGELYALADIGMRMLTPEECAGAQGFKPGALPLDVEIDGRRRPLTKTERYALVGNSVPPRWAELLARLNVRRALSMEAAE
jgi:DNA (cytosine-5)-methyltransferase 1